MISISLCMIVRNEEEVLGRCLESVADLVDEIIIVDTGSTDKTKKIASYFSSKIYDFEWIDDFSAARNFAFSKATQEYIFWLDADDVILEIDSAKIRYIKKHLDSNIDVVMMKYNLGADDEGKPLISFYRERLLKRSKNFQWHDPVHEYLDFYSGRIVNSDVCITHKKLHRTSRNLEIFERLIAQGRELSLRNRFYYARELFFNGRYDDAIIHYNKYLDAGGDGYLPSYLDSCLDLSKCYEAINDKKNALRILFRSFEYSIPRAEACCQIGYQFKEAEDYARALFWFEVATKLKKPRSWGFVIHDFWDFIPYVELSICSYRSGNLADAIMYNNKAAEFKPEHPVVLQNRNFFETLQKQNS